MGKNKPQRKREEQTEQIESKQQDHRFKPKDINKHIKCECSKTPPIKRYRLSDWIEE